MTPDLSTRWLGLPLRSPLVLAACPIGGSMAALQRLEQAGIGAIVLPSLFEEQIRHDAVVLEGLEPQPPGWGEGWGDYFDRLDDYNAGEADYLKYLEDAKQILDVPVIASLNGSTIGGWTDHARRIENAGADALELNILHVPTDTTVTGAEVEERCLDVLSAVREKVKMPLAVKIGPQFSSLPNMAARLQGRGADGLVLFNRFLQPDLDLDTLEPVPSLVLSAPQEVRLPLAWIAILRDQLLVSLAASSGVQRADDILKLLLAGADAVQIASAVLRHGPSYVRDLLDGLTTWLQDRGHESVQSIQGTRSRNRSRHPEMYGRIDYTRVIAGAMHHRLG